MSKFKVGDIVAAHGIKGTVYKNDCLLEMIFVQFVDGSLGAFDYTGRSSKWHNYPVLTLLISEGAK